MMTTFTVIFFITINHLAPKPITIPFKGVADPEPRQDCRNYAILAAQDWVLAHPGVRLVIDATHPLKCVEQRRV